MAKTPKKKMSKHQKLFRKIAKSCQAQVKKDGVVGKARFKAVGACVSAGFAGIKSSAKKK